MSGTQRKGGKKNRKYGRGLRKPSHIRYNAEGRYEKNKARKQAKHAKRMAKKAARKNEQNESC